MLEKNQKFKVFQISKNCALFFYIDNKKFWLGTEQDKQKISSTDLSSELTKKHANKTITAKTFTIFQNPSSGDLSIALVVNVAKDNKDYLYLLTGLPIIPDAPWHTSEESRNWISRTYDASSSDYLGIDYVYLTQDQNTQILTLLAGAKTQPEAYIKNYIVSASEDVKENIWQTFYTAENYDAMLAIKFGKPATAMFPGFYTLTSLNGILSLIFTPIESPFGGPPSVLKFTPPEGAMDLMISYTSEKKTDLYVLAEKGIWLYTATEQINFASAKKFITPRANFLFTYFKAVETNNNRSFFAMEKEDQQYSKDKELNYTFAYLNDAFTDLQFNLVLK